MSEPKLRRMTVEEVRESYPDIDQNGNFSINEVVYVPEEKYKKLLEFVRLKAIFSTSEDRLTILSTMEGSLRQDKAKIALEAREVLKEIGELE